MRGFSKGSDIENLKAACFELAQTMLWQREPVGAADIQNSANRLIEVAERHVHDSDTFLIDVELIARAVRYIVQAHATPHGEDLIWFDHTLRALLEVARPNAEISGNALMFVSDMRDRLAVSH